MKAFLVSSYAEQDLESILRYTIRKWGIDQADLNFELLSSARDRILADPFLPGSKSRDDLAEGCRTFRCGKHISTPAAAESRFCDSWRFQTATPSFRLLPLITDH